MIVDGTHSGVEFKVKHLMISSVKGSFEEFQGEIFGDLEESTVFFTIEVESINTNNADRDQHLKSGDFFDVEKFPVIIFKSTGTNLLGGKILGDINIKGVSKEISLDVSYLGTNKDPWGNTKHGMEISGVLNRTDFGLNWNNPLDSGGVLVGEEVKLEINLQLTEEI